MVMRFCPNDGNLLYIKEGPTGFQFACYTCPYVFNIKEEIKITKFPKNKEVDDIVGDEAYKNRATTTVKCENSRCDGTKAYFEQMQTRSADEAATIFYKCTTCGYQWNEN